MQRQDSKQTLNDVKSISEIKLDSVAFASSTSTESKPKLQKRVTFSNTPTIFIREAWPELEEDKAPEVKEVKSSRDDHRQEIFNQHIDCIAEMADLTYAEIIAKISCLEILPLRNFFIFAKPAERWEIPSKDRKDLITATLSHKFLNSQQKIAVITLLLERGYKELDLICNFELLIKQDHHFSEMIFSLYKKSRSLVSLKVKKLVWKRQFEKDQEYALGILKDFVEEDNPVLFDYAKAWIYSKNHPEDIAHVTGLILDVVNSEKYRALIEGLSDLRTVQVMNEPKMFIHAINKDDPVAKQVTGFLQSHARATTFCCFTKETEAQKIYKKIRAGKRDKSNDLIKEMEVDLKGQWRRLGY